MMSKRKVVEELHKPARRNYERRSFDIRGIDETWQADLVEMIPYARQNKGFNYMLNVIDTMSKFAWSVPVKRKNGQNITEAMKSILKKGRIPTNLQTDRGKEFYNKEFKELMQKFNINLYSTYSNLKASICERFNRTLKNKMWQQFSLQGNYKWIDILDDLLLKYNNTKHRTIGMKPKDVNASKVAEILSRIALNNKKKIAARGKFKIGDKVRISKNKEIFEKGYTPNWSTEIFTISKVQNTAPRTYQLQDYQDKPIAGGFYEEELLKTKYPDIYLVEKVLKKRGNNIYVKWLGFDNSHNSWIKKSDM